MAPRLIVAVAGMPGSGKSMVSRIIAGELGCRVYSMGDVVREETRRRGLEVTAENVERVAVELRRELGPQAVAQLLSEKLQATTGCAVVDGVRSLDEVRVFRSIAPVCIVAVHASPGTRYRRMMERGRLEDLGGLEGFRLRDRSNLALGVGSVIAMADFIIINEAGRDELADNARRVAWVIECDKGKSCSGGGG